MGPPRRRVLPLALATALLILAGCDGDDEAADEPDDADTDVAVVGQDELQWDTESLTADAGEISVSLTCGDAVNHDFTIEETGDQVAACDAGETDTGTVELEEGEYTYVCTVPGHSQTMRGTFTVE